jgi:hypothetical protein
VTAGSSTTSVPAASPVPAAAPTPAVLPPPPAPPSAETTVAPEKGAAAEKAATAETIAVANSATAEKPAVAEKTVAAAKTAPAAKPGAAGKAAAGDKLASLAPPAAIGAAAKLPGIADATAAAAAKAAELPPTKTVEVRDSDIHLVDQPKPEATAVVATAGALPKPGDIGASTCLNVESDGAYWGFRNKCGYSVQYAYCTMDGRNQLTACKDGFVGGSVAPNGFGVLIADSNLRSLNENHDFRWVACQGGAGEVIARLDKSDPPIGRCMR